LTSTVKLINLASCGMIERCRCLDVFVANGHCCCATRDRKQTNFLMTRLVVCTNTRLNKKQVVQQMRALI